MLKGKVNCLMWVERVASIFDMKIVQVLVRSKIVIFVVQLNELMKIGGQNNKTSLSPLRKGLGEFHWAIDHR